MNNQKKIVDEAIRALKKEPIPAGPPHDLLDKVITKVRESEGETPFVRTKQRMKVVGFTKIAAAAVLLIAVGFVFGRFTDSRYPDIEELNRDWQLALANSNIQLKDELNEQFRGDLQEFASQTLFVSNLVTNELLSQLISAIDTSQIQDRRWIAAALGQIELNRVRDLTDFAVVTQNELQRTKQDLAEWIAYNQGNVLTTDKYENPNDSSERSEK